MTDQQDEEDFCKILKEIIFKRINKNCKDALDNYDTIISHFEEMMSKFEEIKKRLPSIPSIQEAFQNTIDSLYESLELAKKSKNTLEQTSVV